MKRLKSEGFWIRGVDLKFNERAETHVDDFVIGDLRDQSVVQSLIDRRFDEVYQLAADMGGAGYLFTVENDANAMHNSAMINLNCWMLVTSGISSGCSIRLRPAFI